MIKLFLLLVLLSFLALSVTKTQVFANRTKQMCHQAGTNNNCNNNSNTNNNTNSQSQSQTQNNNQNVTISFANLPTIAPAPVAVSLPSTGTSPFIFSLFGIIPLGFILRKFA